MSFGGRVNCRTYSLWKYLLIKKSDLHFNFKINQQADMGVISYISNNAQEMSAQVLSKVERVLSDALKTSTLFYPSQCCSSNVVYEKGYGLR